MLCPPWCSQQVRADTFANTGIFTLHEGNHAINLLKLDSLMIYCIFKGASVPFLSREVFNYIPHDPAEALAYSLSLDTTFHMLKAVLAANEGLANFASLGNGTQQCLTCFTLKNQAEVCVSGHHEQDAVPIWTRFGKRMITAHEYMNFMEAFIPDMFHALCDGDTNANSSRKRALKSADRTEQFFETCLERFKKSERLKESMIIGRY